MPFIGNNSAITNPFRSLRCNTDIRAFTSCEEKRYRIAGRVCLCMQFGGKTFATAAQSLSVPPPFAPAACLWAWITYRQSSPLRDSRPGSDARARKTAFQNPFICQRRKREYTALHEPYASGRALQGAPVRSNQMIAFMNVRLSLAGRPPLGEPSSGRTGSSRCQVSKYRYSTCPKATRIQAGYKVCKHALGKVCKTSEPSPDVRH